MCVCARPARLTPLSPARRRPHSYVPDSREVVWLCEVLAEWPSELRAAFLSFATGCPALGPGGLAALSPRLRVTPRHAAGDPDGELPTASTCFNQVRRRGVRAGFRECVRA